LRKTTIVATSNLFEYSYILNGLILNLLGWDVGMTLGLPHQMSIVVYGFVQIRNAIAMWGYTHVYSLAIAIIYGICCNIMACGMAHVPPLTNPYHFAILLLDIWSRPSYAINIIINLGVILIPVRIRVILFLYSVLTYIVVAGKMMYLFILLGNIK
jgi:hypothetical protein